MATINTKNVHRTKALRGHPWGRDFAYDERLLLGYGSTSKMITEAALCLVDDVPSTATAGGVWTPGAAMGLTLVRRLEAHAGLRFQIED